MVEVVTELGEVHRRYIETEYVSTGLRMDSNIL